MNSEILQWLKECSAFRERKEKNRWIGGIVFRKYGIEITSKMKDQMGDLVTDILNGDRYWRLHTKDYPELRGSDYGEEDGTKEILEQNKMLELNYSPNYQNDTKTKI